MAAGEAICSDASRCIREGEGNVLPGRVVSSVSLNNQRSPDPEFLLLGKEESDWNGCNQGRKNPSPCLWSLTTLQIRDANHGWSTAWKKKLVHENHVLLPTKATGLQTVACFTPSLFINCVQATQTFRGRPWSQPFRDGYRKQCMSKVRGRLYAKAPPHEEKYSDGSDSFCY